MAVFDHPDLPTRYRITATTITTGTDTDTATGHSWILDTVAQQWDDLEPGTQDAIEILWGNPESPPPGTVPNPLIHGCPESSEYVAEKSLEGVDGSWCYQEFDRDASDDIPTLAFWFKPIGAATPHPVECTSDPNDEATHGVNPYNGGGGTIPDQIEDYAAVLDAALTSYLGSDGTPGNAGGGYQLELGEAGPLDVVVYDHGHTDDCKRILGTARAATRFLSLDTEADAQVVAHEAYHLVQYHFRNGLVDGYADPYEDKGYTEYPEWGWVHESTAEWAPAYYATVSGTALYDLLDDPEPAWASPTGDLWGPSTHGFYDALDTIRIRPNTLWAGPQNGLVAEGYGSAPFWQYLAERYSDPTIGSDDIVLDYWHQLRDHHHGIDHGATFEALDEVLAEDLPDVVRDFWASLYLLSSSPDTPTPYRWTLASTNPTLWRQRLAQSPLTALHADTFGAERPVAAGPVVLYDNDTETQPFALLPGGASFIDVDFRASISNLEVHVDSSNPVTVTAINYDGSHPYPCTVGSVIVHWEDDEDKELEHCRVLTIAVVAPEPRYGTNPALTTGTITLQTLGGTS